MSERQEAPLVERVVWVVKRDRKRVLKSRDGLLERDAMLPLVGKGLLIIPLDDHEASLYAPVVGLANAADKLRNATQ